MGGKERGEYSVLLNGISAVLLTAKVRTPCAWRLEGVGKKSLDLSEGRQVMVSQFYCFFAPQWLRDFNISKTPHRGNCLCSTANTVVRLECQSVTAQDTYTAPDATMKQNSYLTGYTDFV